MSQPATLPPSPDFKCLDCGYSLRDLPNQNCPECGRWFDFADPSTYAVRGSKSWRRMARPPSMLECSLFLLLTFAQLLMISGPMRWEGSGSCCVTVLGIPALWALCALAMQRWRAVRQDKPRAARDLQRHRGRSRARWAVPVVCVGLFCLTLVIPWPVLLRFRISKPAFDRAVAEFQAGQFKPGRWVGLYYVIRAQPAAYTAEAKRPNAIRFETGASFDPVGFEYDPHPGHETGSINIQVADNWFTYEG